MWIVRNWAQLTMLSIVFLIVGYAVFLWNYGELGEKPIYAELHSYEPDNWSIPLTKITVISRESGLGLLIGVPTDDRNFPNALIAATKKKPDGTFYVTKSIDSKFRVSCEDVEKFFKELNDKKILLSVREQLENQCYVNPQK